MQNRETPRFVVFSIDSHEGGELLNNNIDKKPSIPPTAIFTDKKNSFHSYEIKTESLESIILIDTPALNFETISSFNKFFLSELNNCNVAGFIFLHNYSRATTGRKLFSRVSSVAETLNIPLIITLSRSNDPENTAEDWIKDLPQWKYQDVILAGGTLACGERLEDLTEKAILRRRDLFNSRYIHLLEILKKHAKCCKKLMIEQDVFPVKFLLDDIEENIQTQSFLTVVGMFNNNLEKKQEVEPSYMNRCIIS